MPEASRRANVFVLGLDDHNLSVLESLPDAGDYAFHALLTIDELQNGDEIPVLHLLDKAKKQLDAFEGPVDGIIGFWDFPVSTMVPLLCEYAGTPGPSLEAVLKCEHKYWSRLEQRKVIDEYPAFAVVDPDHDVGPPEGVGFPMWVKPVKSFSSDLAFGVDGPEQYTRAIAEISDGIGRIGEPFEAVLDKIDLPDEIAGAGGRACVVEEAIQGRQVTLEGYVRDGEIHIFGVVDTVNREDVASQDRFQYPSSLPAATADRMAEISRRILHQVGLDDTSFNVEFFADTDSDAVWVLEVNPRHSQSHAELFADVDGVANHRAMLRLALGRDPEMPRREGRHAIAAKWFLRRLADGRATRVPTVDEIAAAERAVPGVTVDVIVGEGDRLSDLPDQDSYSYKIANIYLGGADENDLAEKFDRCTSLLPFEFEE